MNGRSQGMTFWRPFCPSICSTAGSESLNLVTLHFGGSRASVGGICPALRASLAGRPAGVPRRLGFSLAGAGAGDSLAGRLLSAPPRRPSPRGRPPRLPPPKGPHLPSRPSPPPPYLLPLPAGLFHPEAGGSRARGQGMAGVERRHVPQRSPARDSATRLSKNLGSGGVGKPGFWSGHQGAYQDSKVWRSPYAGRHCKP